MVKITIEIEGMKCPMCEAHTNDAIKKAFDVKSVVSSHKENKTVIIAENDISDEKIAKAVSSTGYKIGNITRENTEEKKSFFSKFRK